MAEFNCSEIGGNFAPVEGESNQMLKWWVREKQERECHQALRLMSSSSPLLIKFIRKKLRPYHLLQKDLHYPHKLTLTVHCFFWPITTIHPPFFSSDQSPSIHYTVSSDQWPSIHNLFLFLTNHQPSTIHCFFWPIIIYLTNHHPSTIHFFPDQSPSIHHLLLWTTWTVFIISIFKKRFRITETVLNSELKST